jgi:hypothetical protein
MKKLIITAAILFAIGMTSLNAQNSGLFNRGLTNESETNDLDNNSNSFNSDNSLGGRAGGQINPVLPGQHGLSDNQGAPLGNGILLLAGMGVAFAACHKRKED